MEYVENLEAEKVRVCITGPFELYYTEFGGKIYEDIIINFAKSISRFIENACRFENVVCVSLDEPSLGLAPDLQPDAELIKRVFEEIESRADMQIHLHNPLFYEKILETKIEIIGVECAKNPKNMDFIDLELINSYEKRLRIGIARSDIDGIIAEFNAKHGVNAWDNDELMLNAINEIEPPEIILGRIEIAYKKFGDVIAYIGPDCGLFSFPTQRHAIELLKNVKNALERFREQWTI